MYINRILVALLFSAMLCSAGSSRAQQPSAAASASDVPRVISYQATLSDASGKPMLDGDYIIGAALYSESGAHAIWHDNYRVHAERGVVNLSLGSGAIALPDLSVAGALSLGIRINGSEELPLAQFAASPYALTVPNGAIGTSKLANNAVTAEKMGTDYVASLSVNGQKLSSKGGDVNIVTDGIEATVDPGTNTLMLKGSGNAIDGISLMKGADAQIGTTIIGGNLQVNYNAEIRGTGGLSMYTYGIHNMADPAAAQDAVTLAYFQAHSFAPTVELDAYLSGASTTTSFGNGSETTLNFNQVNQNVNSQYSTATSTFTCSAAQALYLITASYNASSSGNTILLGVYVDGAIKEWGTTAIGAGGYTTGGSSAQVTCIVSLNAGQTIKVKLQNTGAAGTTYTSANVNRFTITKLNSPS